MLLEEIEKFINNTSSCMISSVDEEGFPQTRAMLNARYKNGIKKFYFTTNTSSQKIIQFGVNNKASVYFYDPMHFIWILFLWTVEISQKNADKDLVWRDGDELYYPKGFDDPDFSVLKFTTQKIKKYANFTVEEVIL